MKQTHIKKKCEINSLIYTLSFLVIYPSKSHFYKCQSNTQLFHYALFNSFYQTLNFLKLHFFIMHFYKTPLFHYALFQKAEPNSPIVYFKKLLPPSQFVYPLFHFRMSQNIVLFLKLIIINLLMFLLYPYFIFRTI